MTTNYKLSDGTDLDDRYLQSVASGTGISVTDGNKVNLATVVTAGNAGPSANASPDFSGTFTVPYFQYDAYGRITSHTNRTITLPAKPAAELPDVGAQTYSSPTGSYVTVVKSAVTSISISRDAYGRLTGMTAKRVYNSDCVCDGN